MNTLIATTTAEADAQFKQLLPGDTLRLQGEIAGWRPRPKSFDVPVTIDCTGAVVEDLYAALPSSASLSLDGVNFEGGRWIARNRPALRIDKCRRIRMIGCEISGIDRNVNSAIGVALTGEQLHTEALRLSDLYIGTALSGRQIEQRDTVLRRISADGMRLFGVIGALVDGIDFDEAAPNGVSHNDVLQMDSPAAGLRNSAITVRNVKARGRGQGICGFNHPETGDQGFGDITIEQADIELDHPHGIAFNDIDRLTLRDIYVRTTPGAPYQCRINITASAELVQESTYASAYTENKNGRLVPRPAVAIPSDYLPEALRPKPPTPAEPETIEISLKPGQKLIVTAPS